MKFHLYILLFLTPSFLSCEALRTFWHGERPLVESWSDSLYSNSTKIKVVTNLQGNSLRRFCLDRVIECRILLDTSRSSLSAFYSVPRGTPLQRITIDFTDSIFVCSAEVREGGMNGSTWEPLTISSEDYVSITQIKRLSRDIPNSKVYYNRFIRR